MGEFSGEHWVSALWPEANHPGLTPVSFGFATLFKHQVL